MVSNRCVFITMVSCVMLCTAAQLGRAMEPDNVHANMTKAGTAKTSDSVGRNQKAVGCEKDAANDLCECDDKDECFCKDGTGGENCKEALGCTKELTAACIGAQADCVFAENEEGKATCKCKAVEKTYRKESGKCLEQCKDDSNCKNGAKCEHSGPGQFCGCLKGTEGSFCENVPACRNLDCGSDAVCKYDTREKNAGCKCSDSSLKFDEKDKKCKVSNAVCDATFKKCRRSRGFCYLDENTTVQCKCPENSSYQQGVGCKVPCDRTENNCQNGGKCKGSGESKFCSCLSGTSGHFCQVVDECENETFCGNGKDVGCVFDLDEEAAVCNCSSEYLKFDKLSMKCRNQCRDDSDCKNGGTCAEGGHGRKFCSCLEGTEGDICESVPGCRYKYCGLYYATCVYDTARKTAVCRCRNAGWALDEKEMKCKEQCQSDLNCTNGAPCKESETGKFCSCLKGTAGTFCKTVLDCRYKNCGPHAECVFDVVEKTGGCRCKNSELAFDKKDANCKEQCRENSDCKNGGICERSASGKFCSCLHGAEGAFCERVPGCEYKNCGSDAGCTFSSTGAACVCKYAALTFNKQDLKCKELCVCLRVFFQFPDNYVSGRCQTVNTPKVTVSRAKIIQFIVNALRIHQSTSKERDAKKLQTCVREMLAITEELASCTTIQRSACARVRFQEVGAKLGREVRTKTYTCCLGFCVQSLSY